MLSVMAAARIPSASVVSPSFSISGLCMIVETISGWLTSLEWIMCPGATGIRVALGGGTVVVLGWDGVRVVLGWDRGGVMEEGGHL